jgi:hypothetical protein
MFSFVSSLPRDADPLAPKRHEGRVHDQPAFSPDSQAKSS